MPDVKIAGGTDLTSTLQALASLRPAFHSEADFQLAFAWQVKVHDPQVEVYLETRPAEGVHLDVAFERPDLGAYTAIELKYLTRAWSGPITGQQYGLKNHGAQDIRAYDVVKDICRVEEFTAKRPGANGAVIVITNDGNYWRPQNDGDTSNAAAFRLGDDVVMSGARAWGPRTGPGTKRGRDKALLVAGTYPLHWREYSDLGDRRHGSRFRQLVIEVDPAD